MAANTYGFIGLGNMGGPMCANLIAAGLSVQVFDAADAALLAPEGSVVADNVSALAAAVDTVFLSLPDGKIVHTVCAEIAVADMRRVTTVIDFSTTGPEAAGQASTMLADVGITFVDAPVSGGKAGAIEGTLTVIVSGSDAAVEDLSVPFGAVGGNIFYVGPNPGQAQAVKLLNNFLSATAMAATSEAVLFGQKHGVDISMILDVVNVSTGRNTATMDKFPNRIVPETFDAGFTMALMAKDVALYLEQVGVAGTPDAVGSTMSALWNAAHDEIPGSDFTEIYRYIAGEK
jgi:3-hydroxyisobutyrate dehydrogenase